MDTVDRPDGQAEDGVQETRLAEAATGSTGVVADRSRSQGHGAVDGSDPGGLIESSLWTELCRVPTAAMKLPNTPIL